jgi:hypothetical protein
MTTRGLVPTFRPRTVWIALAALLILACTCVEAGTVPTAPPPQPQVYPTQAAPPTLYPWVSNPPAAYPTYTPYPTYTSQPVYQPPVQPVEPTSTKKPPEPAPPPGGGSWNVLTADLAVTDLYPDNWPQGEIFVRVTDNGPGSPHNVPVGLSCTVQKNPYTGAPPSASGANGQITVDLDPGQTQIFDTGIYLDGTTSWFVVTCTTQVGFKDPNPSNDSYSESFPPPP